MRQPQVDLSIFKLFQLDEIVLLAVGRDAVDTDIEADEFFVAADADGNHFIDQLEGDPGHGKAPDDDDD